MFESILEPIKVVSLRPGTPGREALAEVHLNAAVNWIQQAYAMGDGGISKGYDLLRRRWSPSYPETTGYSIPSLLNVSALCSRPDLKDLAVRLADYLLECATPEGGVVHWQAVNVDRPVVFDTGQVIFGWLAAYDASANPAYLHAARRAGDWLVSVQDPSGAWSRYQHLDVVKVIDTRVAWALLELDKRVQGAHYRAAAVHNLDWALTHQHADGWFGHCSFRPSDDPLTHTLIYTAEGFLECGLLLHDDRYVAAGQKTAAAALSKQAPNGSLASTFAASWKPTSRSSCLTGDCQAARLWLQCYELRGEEKYLDAAVRAIQFVAGTQQLQAANRAIVGGIAGSYPLAGHYERLKYPNWAAKFFIDAIVTLLQIEQKATTVLPYKG